MLLTQRTERRIAHILHGSEQQGEVPKFYVGYFYQKKLQFVQLRNKYNTFEALELEKHHKVSVEKKNQIMYHPKFPTFYAQQVQDVS